MGLGLGFRVVSLELGGNTSSSTFVEPNPQPQTNHVYSMDTAGTESEKITALCVRK